MSTEIDTMLVVAADSEAKAVLAAFGFPDEDPEELTRLEGGLWLLRTGIGKANAAGAVGIALAMHPAERVISLGLGGALPDSGLAIGDRVLATRSVFADEGVDTPEGFLDCRSMGFPLYVEDRGLGIEGDPDLRNLIRGCTDREAVVATVSTCSGRDELATRIRRRTGAGVECMEGAAVLLTCHRMGVSGSEIRVISNTTGDREKQEWDIRRSLGVLGATARAISDVMNG
jgi:futalosine hydrolase